MRTGQYQMLKNDTRYFHIYSMQCKQNTINVRLITMKEGELHLGSKMQRSYISWHVL